MSFYSQHELMGLGLSKVGTNVLISRKASLYGAGNIRIGNNVRIDDFCVLSAGDGGIVLGNYIHIAVFCLLIGKERMELQDFCGLSSRVAVYSSSDDFSGDALTNPMLPPSLTNVKSKPVLLQKHVIVGSGSVILPGVTLAEGVAVGALSVIRKDCHPFSIYCGNPARKTGARSQKLKMLEAIFLKETERDGAIDEQTHFI